MLYALAVGPSQLMLDRALSARSMWMDLCCADAPAETVTRRSHTSATLSALSDRLAPNRAAWRARLPVDSPSRELNPPLFLLLSTSLHYEDVNFVRDSAYGVPISGAIPPTSVPPARTRIASVSVDDWRAGVPLEMRGLRNAPNPPKVPSCPRSDGAHPRGSGGWVGYATRVYLSRHSGIDFPDISVRDRGRARRSREEG